MDPIIAWYLARKGVFQPIFLNNNQCGFFLNNSRLDLGEVGNKRASVKL
jgi:hypothetical protein